MAAKSSLLNGRKQWIVVLCLLVSSALLFFHQVLVPGEVMFSNDGPVGELMSACHQLPARFTGCWENLHGIGNREGAAIPNISFILQWLLQPVLFSKFYTPLALVILGMSAWAFFRELKFAAPACILGGLAAMLQSAFFSVACWGVAAHTLTIAMTFLALAALADTTTPRLWLRTALAGLCVGMGVAEGADVGALCSIFVVLYVIYQVTIAEGTRTKNVLLGAGRVGLMAVCAALLAACAVSELVSNDIKDIAGTKQDASTRAERWNWATQWSLPKREALGIMVPGLFGYRLETGDGSDYWGAIGRAAEWNDYFSKGALGTPPEKYLRSSGTGYYSGVLVIMLALWALLQSLRKDALFNSTQRKWIWFWSATAIVSLLLAFGRYAPFYRLVYALPYFSTIRNPIKYLYFLSMAFVVLFTFGVDGLWRGFVNKTAMEQKRTRPGRFENMWLIGSLVAIALACIAWVVYSSHREALEQYLEFVRFNGAVSRTIAAFSIRQVAFFLAFLVAAAVLVNLTLRRSFSNSSATVAAGIFGLFLIVDLGIANQPWIIFTDYADQNLTNPVLDLLREQPYEHRVGLVPVRGKTGQPTMADTAYRADWQLHQFPALGIQSVDVAQLPRMPQDMAAFKKEFDMSTDHLVRKWQLTNTRYLLGDAGVAAFLNNTLDPEQHRFRIVARYNFVPRPGVVTVSKIFDLTATSDRNGPFALIEFTGALPRTRLYSQWQTNADTSAALDQIASPAFDPEQSVLVTGDVPPPTSGAALNAGTVTIESYAPKRVELKADAAAPAILLLNDRFDPNWKVFVDGQRQPLLRCNYLMRGVYLPSGSHSVEFRFELPSIPLYVSLATLVAGMLLAAFTFVTSRPRETQKEDPKTPKSQRPSPKSNGATAAASRK